MHFSCNANIFRFYDTFEGIQTNGFILRVFFPDVLCCAGIVPSEWPFVRLVKTINDVDLRLNRDRRPKIQNAGVTKCDIIAKNGIIHEINDVINPKQLQRTPISRTQSDSSSNESPYLPIIPKRPFHDFFSFR